MDYLRKGVYFGIHKSSTQIDGIVLTDAEYTHDRVNWHYHQNSYFTYILQGKLFEANRKQSYNCTRGSLLYHNWQDPHYNIKSPEYTRGFHIELEEKWFERHHLNKEITEGSIEIENPVIKSLFNNIYKETKINDTESQITIEGLVLQVFGELAGSNQIKSNTIPHWLFKIKGMLHEHFHERVSLESLSFASGIHPVHISASFSKYFKTTIGDYIRSLKIKKSIVLLNDNRISLAEISLTCGFADQSHYTRIFRSSYGITPMQYRKMVTGK